MCTGTGCLQENGVLVVGTDIGCSGCSSPDVGWRFRIQLGGSDIGGLLDCDPEGGGWSGDRASHMLE